MNRSSTRGFKLSTVFIAVLILAISAIFSNSTVAATHHAAVAENNLSIS